MRLAWAARFSLARIFQAGTCSDSSMVRYIGKNWIVIAYRKEVRTEKLLLARTRLSDAEAKLTNEPSAALAGLQIMSARDGKRKTDHVIVQFVVFGRDKVRRKRRAVTVTARVAVDPAYPTFCHSGPLQGAGPIPLPSRVMVI